MCKAVQEFTNTDGGKFRCLCRGVRVSEEFAKMAERSVKMNGQEEKCILYRGSSNIKTDYERESFVWVTWYHPYMTRRTWSGRIQIMQRQLQD